MKRGLQGLLFVVWSWWGSAGAQSFYSPTNGEVYNFEVGDTLEYFENGTYPTYQIIVIDSIEDYSTYLIYRLSNWRFPQFPPYSLTYYQSQQNSGNLADTTIPLNAPLVLPSCTGCCQPSVYSNTITYNGTDTLFSRMVSCTGGLSNYSKTSVARTLGIVEQAYSMFDYDWNQYLDYFKRLIYYHKKSGRTWGTATFYTGVKETSNNQIIRVSFNPATHTIALQSETSFPPQTVFQLFDLTGRMELEQEMRERSERIDVSALDRGMYLYSVASDKEKLGSGKVVIE